MPSGENNRKLSEVDRDEIIRRYTTLNPDGTWTGVNFIARLFNVSPTTIDNVLRRFNIEKRSPKEAHQGGKRCKPITNVPEVGETPPVCKCGCANFVEWNRRKKHWNAYVDGHYRPNTRLYKSRDWLHNAYITQGRSTEDIAREFGVKSTTVRNFMEKFDIPIRSASESKKGLMIGAKNPAWRGGTTPERQRLYKKDEWKRVVCEVLKRDNYTCKKCGVYRATNTPKLVTHHIKPFSTYPDLRFSADNLVTLCESCHHWIHSKSNSGSEFLG